jgi:hypothetical protein
VRGRINVSLAILVAIIVGASARLVNGPSNAETYTGGLFHWAGYSGLSVGIFAAGIMWLAKRKSPNRASIVAASLLYATVLWGGIAMIGVIGNLVRG